MTWLVLMELSGCFWVVYNVHMDGFTRLAFDILEHNWCFGVVDRFGLQSGSTQQLKAGRTKGFGHIYC
jgi:hypothetical protein